MMKVMEGEDGIMENSCASCAENETHGGVEVVGVDTTRLALAGSEEQRDTRLLTVVAGLRAQHRERSLVVFRELE